MWPLQSRNSALQFVAILTALSLEGCGTTTHSSKRPAGRDQSARARVQRSALEASPLGSFQMSLNGFHFQSGDMGKQIEDHHYCSNVSDEVMQCILFDGTGETAHLTGIEYVITRRMFESFPPEERKLWHSHVYE